MKHEPPCRLQRGPWTLCGSLREDSSCSQFAFTAVGWMDSNSDKAQCQKQKKDIQCPQELLKTPLQHKHFRLQNIHMLSVLQTPIFTLKHNWMALTQVWSHGPDDVRKGPCDWSVWWPHRFVNGQITAKLTKLSKWLSGFNTDGGVRWTFKGALVQKYL